MAISKISDKWTVTSGTVGVDIDRLADNRRGKYVLKFPTGQTPAADPQVDSPYCVVEPSRAYIAETSVYADDKTAGNYIKVQALQYTDGLASAGSAAVPVNAIVSVINTWEDHAAVLVTSTTASYVQFEVSKKNTSFEARVGYVSLRRIPIGFSAYSSFGDTATAGAWTDIVMDTENFDYGSNFSSGNFVAPFDSWYSLSASIRVESVADAQDMGIALYKGAAQWKRGTEFTTGASGDVTLHVAHRDFLNKGDAIDPRVWNGDGSNRSVTAGDFNTWFAGKEDL